MEIKPRIGAGNLLFGMKQSDVEALLGKADKQFKDEDKNVICLYNQYKLRLTFYEDEDFRLGYIVISDPKTILFGKEVIGRNAKEIQTELPEKQFKEWEVAEEDGIESTFNEDNWLMLISEFGEIVKVEVGALIVNDEFEWKFKA